VSLLYDVGEELGDAVRVQQPLQQNLIREG